MDNLDQLLIIAKTDLSRKVGADLLGFCVLNKRPNRRLTKRQSNTVKWNKPNFWLPVNRDKIDHVPADEEEFEDHDSCKLVGNEIQTCFDSTAKKQMGHVLLLTLTANFCGKPGRRNERGGLFRGLPSGLDQAPSSSSSKELG